MTRAAPLFDIYHASGRYRAVEDPIARRILEALETAPMDLDTLEGRLDAPRDRTEAALKDLIEQDLVAPRSSEGPFELQGRAIGSSVIPRSELRQAIRRYVSTHTGGGRFPLIAALEALAGSPGDDRASTLWSQGERLGAYIGRSLIQEGAQPLDGIPELLVREGILAREGDADGDGLGTFSPGPKAPQHLGTSLLAHLVGGFLEGCLEARGAPGARVAIHLDDDQMVFGLDDA